MTFKVGDRVRVYGYLVGQGNGGVVLSGSTRPHLVVKPDDTTSGFMVVRAADGSGGEYCVHPKQCRRLVKQERRRILVEADPEPGAPPRLWEVSPNETAWPRDWVHVWDGPVNSSPKRVKVTPFIEVRRSK